MITKYVFAFLLISTPAFCEPYHRDAFGSWVDSDHDCQNTRTELLLSLSTAATTMKPSGCTILHGKWYDPYTDRTFTSAKDLDIDHVVPLSYAWIHGAEYWSEERRHAFANDPRNLLPVSASANRAKGDSGPLEWLPPNEGFRCQYVVRFLRVSKTYDLVFNASEMQDLNNLKSKLCD